MAADPVVTAEELRARANHWLKENDGRLMDDALFDSPTAAEQLYLADQLDELAKARAEVARLNEWADGMTDRAMKERQTGDALIKVLTSDRAAARKFGEEAAAKYNALLIDNTLTCAFCGQAYSDGTPASRHERLTQHIAQCSAHPIRVVEKERDEARVRIAELERDEKRLDFLLDNCPSLYIGRPLNQALSENSRAAIDAAMSKEK